MALFDANGQRHYRGIRRSTQPSLAKTYRDVIIYDMVTKKEKV